MILAVSIARELEEFFFLTGVAVELPKTFLTRSSLQLGSGWLDIADQVR